MVHALHTIARLLKPGGVLIDIHPGTARPEIVVQTPAGPRFAGYLDEAGGFAEYGLAQAALDETVRDKTYTLEHQGGFAFATHAGSLAALQDYFAENWKSAILTPPVLRAVSTAFGGAGSGKEIVVTEQILIARLRLRS